MIQAKSEIFAKVVLKESDYRTSAISVGIGGILFIAITAAAIILPDLVSVVLYLKNTIMSNRIMPIIDD